MQNYSVSEIEGRIRTLQGRLSELGIDLAILNQNSDIYYYSGSVQPLYLMIPAVGKPIALARKAITRMRTEVVGSAIEPFHGTKDLVEIVARHGIAGCKRIGFTLDGISFSAVERLRQLFEGAELVDIGWEIRVIRMVKSESEIANIAEACTLLAEVPTLVRSVFTPGMTELELSAPIENYFRLNGYGALLRCRREGIEMASCGVCASGVNSLEGTKFDGICGGKGISAGVPYGASRDVIVEGVPVILDYGLTIDGYHGDETRMFTWGRPSDEVLNAYNAMVEIERKIIEELKPGRVCEEIYNYALSLAGESGYADTFMGVGTERVRFVGHGVGLEMDEPPYFAPKMKYPLAEGMVVAIEPKVAVPGIGVIGVEDTVVIRNDGVKVLTDCPTDFIVVE